MAGAEVDILREAFIKNRKISYAARVLCLATPGPQGLKGGRGWAYARWILVGFFASNERKHYEIKIVILLWG